MKLLICWRGTTYPLLGAYCNSMRCVNTCLETMSALSIGMSARMGQPFVKIFREELEMTLMLLLDVGRSPYFGSQKRRKIEIAAELAAVLAFLAINNNDRVGVILFQIMLRSLFPPKRKGSHMEYYQVRTKHEPAGTSTNISDALDKLMQFSSKKNLCFLISDFLADDFHAKIKQVASRHDLVCVRIEDPREHSWTNAGMIALRDSESGELRYFNSGDKETRRRIEELAEQRFRELDSLGRKSACDFLSLSTNESIVDGLSAVFRRREKRRRSS